MGKADNERIAVYCATRNMYREMVVAAKSLLFHKGADKIIFMTEDDVFPEKLPDVIRNINISNQIYFRQDGPNYQSMYSYMVLIRAAFSKIFPEYDTVLSMDVDTIVRGNIDGIWITDLSDAYLAAAQEINQTMETVTQPYYNMGVALMNLKKLREDGLDDILIDDVNREYYVLKEQDAINIRCAGHIVPLRPEYNACRYTYDHVPPEVVVRHYAYEHPWNERSDYKFYESMRWEDIL